MAANARPRTLRLLAERAARKEGGGADTSGLQHSLLSSESPATVAGGGAGAKKKETREELIQRLVREKRERDARRAAAAASSDTANLGASTDSLMMATRAGGREAWSEASLNASARADAYSHVPGTPDSLAESRGRTDFPGHRPQHAKRPQSAPKTGPASARPRTSGGAEAGGGGGGGGAQRQRPRSASAERKMQFKDFSFQAREVRNKHSKEAAVRQREDRMRQELTFRPQINSYVPTAHRVGGGSAEESIERLARSRREEWEKRERVRVEAEERAIKESCTFKPKLKPSAKQAPAAAPGVPVEVRLINEANSKQSMRQKAKRHLEEIEFQRTCTFKPQINTTSRYLDTEQRPLHERVGELQRARRMKLQEAKVKEEMGNADLTFKPTINERSVRIAGDRTEPVTKRLVENSHTSLQRKLAKMAEIAQDMEQEQTFHPKPNPNSDRILSASDKFGGKSFFERQQEAIEKRAQDEKASPEEFPFRPKVGTNSSLLVQDREAESLEERIDRMAYKDKERQELSREAMKDMYYSQFSFRPQINRVSKQLGHSHTVEELHEDRARRERMDELVRRANEEQEIECTFRPDVGRKRPTQSMNDLRQQSIDASGERSRYSIDVHDVETLTERIKHHAMRKGAAIDQERRRREYDELKECTFKPQIRSKPAKQQQGPIIVRGLGRHLELKELAQKKEEEKRERERKAFLLDTTARSTSVAKPYTVPAPFKLSSNDSKHQERRKALEEEVSAQEMAECTFRPKVNDGRVRQYLDRIMSTEVDMDAAEADASLLNIR